MKTEITQVRYYEGIAAKENKFEWQYVLQFETNDQYYSTILIASDSRERFYGFLNKSKGEQLFAIQESCNLLKHVGLFTAVLQHPSLGGPASVTNDHGQLKLILL